jgi:hypothetical protein
MEYLIGEGKSGDEIDTQDQIGKLIINDFRWYSTGDIIRSKGRKSL